MFPERNGHSETFPNTRDVKGSGVPRRQDSVSHVSSSGHLRLWTSQRPGDDNDWPSRMSRLVYPDPICIGTCSSCWRSLPESSGNRLRKFTCFAAGSRDDIRFWPPEHRDFVRVTEETGFQVTLPCASAVVSVSPHELGNAFQATSHWQYRWRRYTVKFCHRPRCEESTANETHYKKSRG